MVGPLLAPPLPLLLDQSLICSLFRQSVFVVAAILSGFLFVDPVKVIEERRTATNLSQRVIDARIAAELARSQEQGDGGIAASGTERATLKSKEHREAAIAEE